MKKLYNKLKNQYLEVDISLKEIISALKKLPRKERESILEDLLAALSPSYLKSIKEAREDYKKGRVSPHEEVFKSLM